MRRSTNNQGVQFLNHDIAVSADKHLEDKDLERSLVQPDNLGQGTKRRPNLRLVGTDCG